ncbi:MAG: hypothetical protein MHM6MM_003096 [Cercozoa sp. M6MM]
MSLSAYSVLVDVSRRLGLFGDRACDALAVELVSLLPGALAEVHATGVVSFRSKHATATLRTALRRVRATDEKRIRAEGSDIRADVRAAEFCALVLLQRIAEEQVGRHHPGCARALFRLCILTVPETRRLALLRDCAVRYLALCHLDLERYEADVKQFENPLHNFMPERPRDVTSLLQFLQSLLEEGTKKSAERQVLLDSRGVQVESLANLTKLALCDGVTTTTAPDDPVVQALVSDDVSLLDDTGGSGHLESDAFATALDKCTPAQLLAALLSHLLPPVNKASTFLKLDVRAHAIARRWRQSKRFFTPEQAKQVSARALEILAFLRPRGNARFVWVFDDASEIEVNLGVIHLSLEALLLAENFNCDENLVSVLEALSVNSWGILRRLSVQLLKRSGVVCVSKSIKRVCAVDSFASDDHAEEAQDLLSLLVREDVETVLSFLREFFEISNDAPAHLWHEILWQRDTETASLSSMRLLLLLFNALVDTNWHVDEVYGACSQIARECRRRVTTRFGVHRESRATQLWQCAALALDIAVKAQKKTNASSEPLANLLCDMVALPGSSQVVQFESDGDACAILDSVVRSMVSISGLEEAMQVMKQRVLGATKVATHSSDSYVHKQHHRVTRQTVPTILTHLLAAALTCKRTDFVQQVFAQIRALLDDAVSYRVALLLVERLLRHPSVAPEVLQQPFVRTMMRRFAFCLEEEVQWDFVLRNASLSFAATVIKRLSLEIAGRSQEELLHNVECPSELERRSPSKFEKFTRQQSLDDVVVGILEDARVTLEAQFERQSLSGHSAINQHSVLCACAVFAAAPTLCRTPQLLDMRRKFADKMRQFAGEADDRSEQLKCLQLVRRLQPESCQ